ncbi:enhancer of split mgamma protein-like [Onthophagus taurus]|uniref:enhancer of split mgamma protein-like n=1 Tax=Onthophagus taurus TaxID=166361 RepID=UPI000C20EB03|nr:enhancer of split mgamma protein-like [Onthophagus taurus]
MAPTAFMVQNEFGEEPISRTYQYRKVMKPMLERKRRARINRCLDELKELMVSALQNEGENVSKLEKADILELTVRHLHNLKRQHQLVVTTDSSYADRFKAGFSQCAQEVSHFIAAPTKLIDPASGRKLMQHLGTCVRQLEQSPQQNNNNNSYPHPSYSPPITPNNNNCNNKGFDEQQVRHQVQQNMWRPW